MNKLTKSNQQVVSGQELSDYVKSLCSAVVRMNTIRAFPLSDVEIVMWSKTIERVVPDATKEELDRVIDGFLTDEYPYDKELGVKNLVKGVELLRRNNRPKVRFDFL